MKRSILFLFVGCALLLAGCGGRIGRGVTVGGTDVSRMTAGEATAAVTAREAGKIGAFSFTLTCGEKTLLLPASRLCVNARAEDAVRRALELRFGEDEKAIPVAWTADALTVKTAAADVARAFYCAPEDAACEADFSLAEPFSYTEGSAGARVDEAKLTKLLSEAVEKRSAGAIEVPMLTVPAAVTAETLAAERTAVARYTTSFEKAPYNAENRVHNIVKAAKLVNGTQLLPGETFDCNAVLGDRNAENGWAEAPAIRGGAYVNEYGGGVCQVSSTLYNAVLAADLAVAERHPHSWPMGYVDIGRDAAISTGGKNFRFINDSGSAVYIGARADIKTGELTVTVYGRALPDGQYIEIASEETGLLEQPETAEALDETLPAKTSVVFRAARQGRTSRTHVNRYTAEGTLLSSEVVSNDVYRSIDGLTYVSADIYYS